MADFVGELDVNGGFRVGGHIPSFLAIFDRIVMLLTVSRQTIVKLTGSLHIIAGNVFVDQFDDT